MSRIRRAVKGFIDPITTKVEDWKWRPLADVDKELKLKEVPDYIQAGYGDFMADQLKRAEAGDLNARDLIKAYTITQSSIGRGGLSHATATKAGLKLPHTGGEVRPEGAFAEWLGSPLGQRYLDMAERGELDSKALKEIQAAFAPFGKQNDQVAKMEWAAQNLPDMATDLNTRVTGSLSDWRNYTDELRGIAAAKSGFVGSLLGRGDVPTLDARQLNLHATTPPVGLGSIQNRGGGTGGRELVDRLSARQEALGLKIDPSLDPFYQHLGHHAVWDKIGNTETTHEDLVRAMRDYNKGGAVHMADGGMVDSVPEEAIKNTVKDPQAARLLDLDLAKYALMNQQPQKMAGGGIAHMAAGGARKVAKKVVTGAPSHVPDFKIKDLGGLAPVQPVSLETKLGAMLNVNPWDVMHRNQQIMEVSGLKVPGEVISHGGQAYARDLEHIKQQIGGASNEDIAKRVQKRFDIASREGAARGGTGEVVASPFTMGDTSVNFATPVTDLYRKFFNANATNKDFQDISDVLRDTTVKGKKPFADAPNFDDPAVDQYIRENPEFRKAFLLKMQTGKRWQELTGINPLDALAAFRDPNLLGVSPFYAGHTLIDVQPGAVLRPSSNSTYSHDFSGTYGGSIPNTPVPILLNEAFTPIAQEIRARSLAPTWKLGPVTNDQIADMSTKALGSRNENISELVTDEMIRRVEDYHKGLKSGAFPPDDLTSAMQHLKLPKFKDGGEVQHFDEGGEVSQSELDRMKFELAQSQNPTSPVMQATPRGAIQDFIGTAGGYMDRAGKFVSEAIAPTAEKHPVKHFLADLILASSLKSAGTALQDYTGTAREADEDNPVRGVIDKDWRKLSTSTEPLLDPRALDIAGFATPAIKGAKKLATVGAKAVAPFAKSTAEMAAELYTRGQMPGMVAPNAFMAEPSAPKPAKALAPANEQGFYSPTEAAALNLQRKVGSGQSFLNDILKQENVRPDEINAMGLDTFLKDKPNATAAEVQDYITKNKIQLGERVYKPDNVTWDYDDSGNLVTTNLPDPYTISSEYGKTYITNSDGRVLNTTFGNKDEAKKYIDQLAIADDLQPSNVKYKEYSLPGGENYREVTLNLPSGKREDMIYKEQSLDALKRGALDYAAMGDLNSAKQLSTRAEKLEREIEQLKRQPQNRTPEFPKQAELDAIDARMAQLKAEGNREEFGKLQSERSELRRERQDYQRQEQDRIAKEARANQYRSSHWEDPNVLAHLRMSDRVTDGKKTLLVDEVQSDWHQAGRERGYKGDEIDTNGWTVERLYVTKPDEVAVYDARGEEVWAGKSKGDEAQTIAKVVEELKKKQVPQAPYKDDWYQLALRRAIKEAIDGGYDRVALPTGGEVAQRFGLANHIDRLDYHKNSDGTYGLSAIKNGREVVAREYLKQNELFDLVGKEMGEKMAKGQGKDSVPIDVDLADEYGFDAYKSLTGLDLVVGGKGMKKYYDEVYPNYLKKFGKKYGASVGETTVDADGVAKPLRYMDITPAMREEFKTGIHMKKGGKVSFADSLDAMRHELTKAK